MAEFTSTAGSAQHLEQIIMESKERLYLISPLLKLTDHLFEMLKKASERGVKITILFSADELNPVEKMMLTEMNDIELYYSESINAKCYFNEKNMLLTSMDACYSPENSRFEMGVFLSKPADNDIYEKASDEIFTLINSSLRINVAPAAALKSSEQIKMVYQGFCIKCAMPISYNIEKPYCRQCQPKNYAAGTPGAEENYCHSCATRASVRLSAPLCGNCSTDKRE